MTFQTAALIIFLWQTFTSISHYTEDPTGTTVEKVTLADIDTLRIVACDVEQFSVSKSHEFGYIWKSSFLNGNILLIKNIMDYFLINDIKPTYS